MMKQDLSEIVRQSWEEIRIEMIEISRKLWSLAEIGMLERQSSSLLADWCESSGFVVENAVGGLPTAFTARYGKGKPTIGLLAEYDALPGLANSSLPLRDFVEREAGHGCGHNWIGAGTTGAAIAVKKVLSKLKIDGEVVLFGCPAEELLWGKVAMLREGVFDGTDVLLATHGSYKTAAKVRPNQSLISGEFVYSGEAGHSSRGGSQNALDSVELAVQSIERLRAHQFPDCSVEHTVRTGGLMPNISPDEARLWVYVRHVDYARAKEVYHYVVRICQGAASLNNTRCREQFLTATRSYLPNETIGKLLFRQLEIVGPPKWTDEHITWFQELVAACAPGEEFELHRGIDYIDDGYDTSSQDDGEASWHIPLGRISWALPTAVPFHHWARTACAGSDAEIPSALVASEALALAMMELVTQPTIVKTARDELNQRRSGKPSPPLVGAFHTFTCDPNSFWNNTWNEPLTIEEAGDNRSNQ